jgi:hypothetical protein
MSTMRRDKHIKYLILAIGLLAGGCFEEDEKVPPHVPGDEQSFTFERSIYSNQSYFDLGTNSILAENVNAEWVLRFGAQAGDWIIGINSANYWGVYNTGSADPDSIPDDPEQEKWVFDHSSGDPDSTAFAGWVVFTEEDTSYTNHIYLIGNYDGISYKASWVIQFYHVDDSLYKFRMRPIAGGEWQPFEVPKSPFHNYLYFSTSGGGKLVQIEPDQELWDLQFTQYGSIIYTNEGEPYPYYVRGVLLNRYMVSAAIDSVKAFADITFEDVGNYAFSRRQDFIGYEWKDVEVDVTSNTAVYTVIPGITYIIMDTEGFFYKFRFVSYYNDLGEKGFPVIEHLRL